MAGASAPAFRASARMRPWLAVWALASALGLAGCALSPRPTSATEAARIRAACPEGTFIGAMTVGCPEFAR